jgi:hypothetical protein
MCGTPTHTRDQLKNIYKYKPERYLSILFYNYFETTHKDVLNSDHFENIPVQTQFKILDFWILENKSSELI